MGIGGDVSHFDTLEEAQAYLNLIRTDEDEADKAAEYPAMKEQALQMVQDAMEEAAEAEAEEANQVAYEQEQVLRKEEAEYKFHEEFTAAINHKISDVGPTKHYQHVGTSETPVKSKDFRETSDYNIGPENRKKFWVKEQQFVESIKAQKSKTPRDFDAEKRLQGEYAQFLREHYLPDELPDWADVLSPNHTVGVSQFEKDKKLFEELKKELAESHVFRDATPHARRLQRELDTKEEEQVQEEKEAREQGGYETTRRFNDQCYLIASFDQIMNHYQQEGLHNTYMNFSEVTDQVERSNNMLMARPGPNILNLCPDMLAPLQPEIRIFKVFNKDAFKEELSESQRTHEFRFSTEFDEANFLGEGRRPGDDAGIESFTWTLQGETEAEAGRVVDAKAVFFFRNMADFIAELVPRKATLKDKRYRYADLAMYAATQSDFKLKVSVGWSSPQAGNLEGLFQSGALAREIARTTQNSKIIFHFNTTKYEYDLKEDGSLKVTAIYGGHVDQTLRNMDYDIFQGKLDVNTSPIQYRMAVLKALRKILQKTGEVSKGVGDAPLINSVRSEDMLSILNKQLHGIPNIPQVIKDNWTNSSVQQGPGLSPATNGQYLIAELNLLSTMRLAGSEFTWTAIDQYDIVNLGDDLVKKIYGNAHSPHHVGEVVPRLLNEVEMTLEYVTKEAMTETHGSLLNRILSNPRNTLSVASITEKNFLKYQRQYREGTLSRVHQGVEIAPTPSTIHRVLGSGEGSGDIKIDASGIFEARALQDDNYKIYFMKLGDIIEAATAEFKAHQSHKGRKVAKSNIEDIRFIIGSLNTGFEPFKGKQISLADLPISLDAFYYWYTTEIIEKDKPKLMLLDFFKSIINTLIIPACQEQGERINFVANRYNFSIPVGQGAAPADFPLEDGKKYNLQKLRRVKKKQVRGGANQRHIDYSYIFLSNTSSRLDLSGKRHKDEEDYIFHLSAGEECGLVKGITFRGADIPFIQEARDEAAYGNQNDKNLQSRLMIVHNANVDMVGNTIFQPGMLVHIAPKYAGMGQSSATSAFGGVKFSSHREIAHTLGIGGYYQIQSVDASIDTTGFWTSLRTLFIAPSKAGFAKKS